MKLVFFLPNLSKNINPKPFNTLSYCRTRRAFVYRRNPLTNSNQGPKGAFPYSWNRKPYWYFFFLLVPYWYSFLKWMVIISKKLSTTSPNHKPNRYLSTIDGYHFKEIKNHVNWTSTFLPLNGISSPVQIANFGWDWESRRTVFQICTLKNNSKDRWQSIYPITERF